MSGYLRASELTYAPGGDDDLFVGVTFTVSAGDRVALVGPNGAGKTTLMRILAGELKPGEGTVTSSGDIAYMPQDVGLERAGETVRELLVRFAPPELRGIGTELARCEKEMVAGDAQAGLRYAEAITEWGVHGGYAVEAEWDAVLRRVVRAGLDDLADRPCSTLSGGERKQVVLDVLLQSGADAILLDEPDNFLDIPAKIRLEEQIRACPKALIMVSHDRELLARSVNRVMTLEGRGMWVHPAGYESYRQARERRQSDLGDELRRWREEERRLYQHFKLMKQRAAVNAKNATKADAAETRWQRFVAAGEPPPPVAARTVAIRLPGARSGRVVLKLARFAIAGLVKPFDADIRFGERIGVIGANGSGKSHLLRSVAGDFSGFTGSVSAGSRVVTGYFTQANSGVGLTGRQLIDIVAKQVGNNEDAMSALARYQLSGQAQKTFEQLSGGQKARLEILCLELTGANLLVLDEPTDNLDVDSCDALELALQQMEGTVITVSHDRAHLRQMDRFLLLTHAGDVYEITDYAVAVAAIATAEPPTGHAVRTLSEHA